MTTATDSRPSTPTTASGGATPDEKKAAVGFTALGFLLGGPVGGVIAALAVGIEQAFIRAGWDRPDWTRLHASMTPEEVAERRRLYAEQAAEYLREAKERRAARAAARKEHQERMKKWFENDKNGDKPDRPEMRNPWEFLRDFLAASKSRYRLFDEKMARGNEKVNDAYGAIGNFFRDLWNFFAGLVEGTREGWRQWKQDNSPHDGETPEQHEQPGGEETGQGPEYSWGEPGAEQPNQEPAAELPKSDDESPAVDPPPVNPEPEPAAGSGPATEPGPTPLPNTEQPQPLPGPEPVDTSTGPAGPEGSPAIEGDVMTADGLPVSADVPAHMGPQGATNLDLLYESFAPAMPVLRSIPPQVGELRQRNLGVRQRVSYIAALSNTVGVPPAVASMVLEVYALIRAVEEGLLKVEEHHGTAEELTQEALAGLNPAAEEQSNIHAQGASGDALNRVGH